MSLATDRPDLGFRWLGREDLPEGTLLSVEIPEECPAFRGHFPGRSILPAVAQLALVEEGLARLEGATSSPPPAIVEISGLRLRRTVGPGERLTLWLGEASERGMRRFEIRSGELSVSGGSVRTVAGEPSEKPGASPLDIEGDECEIFALGRVPHAPPALLIESLVARGAAGAQSRGLIPADSPFASFGRTPAYLGLEIAAQTAALVEALGREGEESGPRVGYLVAIRQARCFVRTLPVGVPLDVFVFLSGSAPPLSIYEIRVGRKGTVWVEGTISTWIAEGER